MFLTIELTFEDSQDGPTWTADIIDHGRTTGQAPRYVNAEPIVAGNEAALFRKVREEVQMERARRARPVPALRLVGA